MKKKQNQLLFRDLTSLLKLCNKSSECIQANRSWVWLKNIVMFVEAWQNWCRRKASSCKITSKLSKLRFCWFVVCVCVSTKQCIRYYAILTWTIYYIKTMFRLRHCSRVGKCAEIRIIAAELYARILAISDLCTRGNKFLHDYRLNCRPIQ